MSSVVKLRAIFFLDFGDNQNEWNKCDRQGSMGSTYSCNLKCDDRMYYVQGILRMLDQPQSEQFYRSRRRESILTSFEPSH